jgi:hypothetical protein
VGLDDRVGVRRRLLQAAKPSGRSR